MTERSLWTSQAGFSLVTALFILLVLAFLGGIMATMSGVQSRSSLWAVQGARVYYAARSGLEWGIAESLSTGSCTPGNLNIGGIAVTVACVQQGFEEGDQAYNVYHLTATAEWGVFGNSDYVSRRVRARVTGAEP